MSPTLENDCLRVSFDPVTGGFRSIFDKRLGIEYLAEHPRPLMFRCIVPREDRLALPVDASHPEMRIEGRSLRSVFRTEDLEAIASITLEEPASLVCGLALRNHGNANVEETIFPWVRSLRPLDGCRIVSPHLWWMRNIEDPFGKALGGDHRSWNEHGQKLVLRYPSHLSTAWCDYGTDAGGLAIEGRQRDFGMMDFFLHKVVDKTKQPIERTLDLGVSQPRRVRAGETWTTPEVRIVVHEGDWHCPADEHRRWLETWIAKPDRPRRFAESIGWHFAFLKHQDGLARRAYEDLPAVAEAALSAGCRYILLFGWQEGGHDNNYFYRYLANDRWGGADGLRAALANVRAMGVEVIPFFNGTLANTGMPEHDAFGRNWEAKTRTGAPLYAGDWVRHNDDVPTRNRSMMHHEICPCGDQQAYFLETVRRIVREYGFGNLQLDQISEKMFPCYNEDHRHTLPDRAYVDGYAALLPETRRIVRGANPEGVMISECTNDFTGQWCDGSWDWQQTVFPEPVLFSLPWLRLSHETDALEFAEANKAFVYGMHLDLKIDGGDGLISDYPEFAGHVRNLAELRESAADYCVDADFRDTEGLAVAGRSDVMVRVYRNTARRRTGVAIAELGGRPAGVSIGCPEAANAARVHLWSTRGRRRSLASAAAFRMRLQPYEVRVLGLDAATGPEETSRA